MGWVEYAVPRVSDVGITMTLTPDQQRRYNTMLWDVMGAYFVEAPPDRGVPYWTFGPNRYIGTTLPDLFADWAAAGRLLEWMRGQDERVRYLFGLYLIGAITDRVEATGRPFGAFIEEMQEISPEAIALAAIKALGLEDEG